MRAGADVNATNEEGISVLAMAASNGCSTVIAKLLSAGAVDPEGFDEPLRCALFRPEPRICALLMRAGAKLPIPGPGSHQRPRLNSLSQVSLSLGQGHSV